MNRVRLYYDHYRAFYPTASAHVVCALHNGTVGLEGQLSIIIGHFREMDLATAQVHHYNVPVDRTVPGQGTVVALSGQVYVQDRLVGGFSEDPQTGKKGTDGDHDAEKSCCPPDGSGIHNDDDAVEPDAEYAPGGPKPRAGCPEKPRTTSVDT